MQRAIISGAKGTKVKVMNWQTQFNSGEVVYRDDSGMVICGNALDVLRGFPDNSISCCVTSPPYFHLRKYGCEFDWGGDKNCKHEWQSIKEKPQE